MFKKSWQTDRTFMVLIVLDIEPFIPSIHVDSLLLLQIILSIDVQVKNPSVFKLRKTAVITCHGTCHSRHSQ